MARYKPGSAAPTAPIRIDGTVWQTTAHSRTLRAWPYPTMHPSNRFERYNALARQIDTLWPLVPPMVQTEWNVQAKWYYTNPSPICMPRRKCITCDIWDIPDFWDPDMVDGKQFHRAVNVNRLQHGLPYQSRYIILHTDWHAPDCYMYPGRPYTLVMYSQAWEVPGPYDVTIYARTSQQPNHPYYRNARAFRALVDLTVEDHAPTSIEQWLAPWRAARPGKTTHRLLARAVPGDSPFHATQLADIAPD